MKLPHLAALLILSTLLPNATAQKKDKAPLDLKGKTVAERFEQLLPGMGGKDIASRHGPQQEWQAICYKAGAPGNETLRLEVCKLMIAKLGPETPNPARFWLLKQLEFLGRAESVDSVAALLQDKDALIHDGAVRCLANNPAPEATAKLIAALPEATGKFRIGLVNALGFRADKSAVDALAFELYKGEADVARAAAKALGKIRTPEAAAVLGSALDDGVKNEKRFWAADAYLLCADQQLKEGKTADAHEMYAKLLQSKDEPRSIHLAAFQGVLKTSGDKAGPMILDALAQKDADRRGIAIAQIETVGPVALKHLAANIDKLPTTGQVTLLGALATRGDKTQLPVALAAAKSEDEGVQRAGILAVGKLGDASVVPMLINTMFAGAKLGGVARDSLTALASEGVDGQIIASLKEENNVAHRKTLIAVLESRRAVGAVPLLLEDACREDAGLRTSAMSALRQLAEPVHIPVLIYGLLKTAKGAERTEAELTIVAVSGKILEPEKRAEPVLYALKKTTPADRIVLLPLLGRLGGSNASLAIIRDALASDVAEQHDAGVQATCNWPEPSVSDDLIKLVQGAKEPGQRQMVLRSLVRVNAAPSDKPTPFRLDMLKKAMTLASNDDDRRMVLVDGLAFVKDINTLRFAVPYLEQKTLAQAACKTIVELAHSRMLREPNMTEFEPALNRVIALCKDKELVERAKKYKQGG